MEDVLDVYAQPYDLAKPVVCFDEMPYQLIGETRHPIAAQPGQLERFDYEYKRAGTCNLFGFFQPLAGWRHIKVTQRRTCIDFAFCMRELTDELFPNAPIICMVMDNLNTHSPASLYDAFPPAEARRILRRLAFHHTPCHASWLNMIEIEFSVLNAQCLDRRIGDIDTLTHEIAAWERQRNAAKATVQWRFTPEAARVKLDHLYLSKLNG
jgi:hypothetical protein